MDYKRIVGYIVTVIATLMLLVVNCLAQDGSEEKVQDHTCTVSFGGQAAVPFGKEGDNFKTGWSLQAGGGFAISHPEEPGRGVQWLVTANYMYARLDATSGALSKITAGASAPFPGAISAHGSFSAVTIDPTMRKNHVFGPRIGLYVSGGFGWLHRGVGINGANPATLLQPAAATLGTATSDSGVFDGGAGLNFTPKPLGGLMIFVEGRVYQGAAINSSTRLVPLSAGIRW